MENSTDLENTLEQDDVQLASNGVDASGDASLTTTGTRAAVMQQVQTLMQELEQKRNADKQMLEEFRLRLQNMVDQMCGMIEERILTQHKETNTKVEAKLQYLNEVLERVCGLENEIHNFKSAVGCLFKDLHE